MKALKNDGFFNPTVKTITYGEWKQDKLYHFVFLSIMQILRGGDGTPTPRTSPKARVLLPRESKLATIDEMNKMYAALRDALIPPAPSNFVGFDHVFHSWFPIRSFRLHG